MNNLHHTDTEEGNEREKSATTNNQNLLLQSENESKPFTIAVQKLLTFKIELLCVLS